MRTSKYFSCFCLILVVLFLGVITWVFLNSLHYTPFQLYPGMTYQIKDRVYHIPTDMEVRGRAFILETDFIESLRELYVKTTHFLNHYQFTWWLSGGTLLGAMRNQAIPSAFDDDVDLHVKFTDKNTLLRLIADNMTDGFGIQSINLKGIGQTRITAAVRFQLIHQEYPVLDIFFTQVVRDKVCKIDGWDNNSVLYNHKEIWDIHDIFPIQATVIDQLPVKLPARPVTVLMKQYGQTCMKVIIPRSICLAHLLPQKILFAIMRKDSEHQDHNEQTQVNILKEVDKLVYLLVQ